jgi:predicted site-specific integrase-resolvase
MVKKEDKRIKFAFGIELIPLDVLSELLDVHVTTIQRYIKCGFLKARRIGQRYYVTRENFTKFMNKGSNKRKVRKYRRNK